MKLANMVRCTFLFFVGMDRIAILVDFLTVGGLPLISTYNSGENDFLTGFFVFELIKTVMEINPCGVICGRLQTVFFEPVIDDDNTLHHISIHTNTHTNTHSTVHHRAPSTFFFQHRYRPTSFQVVRGLHRKHLDTCFLHDVNKSDHQGMGHGPRTLALRQDRAVCAERANWTCDHCHCY